MGTPIGSFHGSFNVGERHVMAQKVQVTLVDDLDGSEAEETVSFSLDGAAYEIDLSEQNASELRSAFDRYVEAARRAGGSRRNGAARRTARRTPRSASGPASPVTRSTSADASRPT